MARPSGTLSEDQARTRFEKYKSKDPFPFIPPALLNSADIHQYVMKTGMIAPYNARYLKSSSYEVQIGDRVIFWDEEGAHRDVELSDDGEVELYPNSLMFFWTKQKFRLPDYMAARFNLRIKNVHRGLLLGTGPLVDPGFEGNILIPVHNLTTNPYTFRSGENLIWVEFTKISPNDKWQDDLDRKYDNWPEFVSFPNEKKNGTPRGYLSKSAPHRPIRNAIPGAIKEAKRLADGATKASDEAKRKIAQIQWTGIIAIIVTLIATYFGLVSPILSLVDDTNAYLQSINKERRDYDAMTERLESLEAEVNALKNAAPAAQQPDPDPPARQ